MTSPLIRTPHDDADSGALAASLQRLARVPRLAIITDFDGTLATPGSSAPLPAALAALRRLARIPATTVAVLSARDLASLRRIFTDDPAITLLGSLGLENPWSPARRLSTDEAAALDRLAADLRQHSAITPGTWIERKSLGLALHIRSDADVDPIAIAFANFTIPSSFRSFRAGTGFEIAVADASKATGLELARTHLAPEAILFAGDDESDEAAFAALRPADLGIKIGPGQTRAPFRVPSPEAFAAILAQLAIKRQQ